MASSPARRENEARRELPRGKKDTSCEDNGGAIERLLRRVSEKLGERRFSSAERRNLAGRLTVVLNRATRNRTPCGQAVHISTVKSGSTRSYVKKLSDAEMDTSVGETDLVPRQRGAYFSLAGKLAVRRNAVSRSANNIPFPPPARQIELKGRLSRACRKFWPIRDLGLCFHPEIAGSQRPAAL